MTRLIDADALKEAEKRIATMPWGDWRGNKVEFTWTSQGVQKLIDKSPTIDAVKVVRCKDCEYAVGQSFEGYLHCDVLKILIDETGYCCYGVRR